MARREVVEITDDLDGTPAASTVTFGVDGQVYEIDLSRTNEGKLRDALSRYIDAGRKKTQARVVTRTKVPADKTTIRAWAQAHGYKVSSRGRIPAEVMAAFEAADG